MKKNNQGSVLLIALVFLLLLAIAGVASIRMNTNSSLISQATIDREIAFQRAERNIVDRELFLSGFVIDQTMIPASQGGELRLGGNVNSDQCVSEDVCFSSRCSNGLCFFGVYDQTDFDSCSVDADHIVQMSFDKLLSKLFDAQGVRVRDSVIEFMCYRDGTPQFRVSTIGTGVDEQSVVHLTGSYAQPVSNLPGILSVNRDLINPAVDHDGITDIVSRFCANAIDLTSIYPSTSGVFTDCNINDPFSPQKFQIIGDKSNGQTAIYDWNRIPGINIGGSVLALEDDSRTPLIPGDFPTRVKADVNEARLNSGVVRETGIMNNDEYFRRYFGVVREQVTGSAISLVDFSEGNYARGISILNLREADLTISTVTIPSILDLKGDVSQAERTIKRASAVVNTTNVAGSHEAVIIVRPPPSTANFFYDEFVFEIANKPSNFALLYVEGSKSFSPMGGSGVFDYGGAIAVEGYAYQNGAININPVMDANDIIREFGFGSRIFRTAWSYGVNND